MDTKTQRHHYFTMIELDGPHKKSRQERKEFLVNNYGWDDKTEIGIRADVIGQHWTQDKTKR